MDNLKTIKLDGVDYQAEAPVIERLTKARTDNEQLATQLKEATDKLTAATGRADGLAEEVEGLKIKVDALEKNKMDEAEINHRVDEKIDAISVATQLGVEVKDGMPTFDIKKAVISKRSPEFKFDGKSDVYVEARYDAIVEVVHNTADAKVREAGSQRVDTSVESGEVNVADSRQKMIERMKRNSSSNEDSNEKDAR